MTVKHKYVSAAPPVSGKVDSSAWNDDHDVSITPSDIGITIPLPPSQGGTGTNNGNNTLIIPSGGTAALLQLSNEFTRPQIIRQDESDAVVLGPELIINPNFITTAGWSNVGSWEMISGAKWLALVPTVSGAISQMVSGLVINDYYILKSIGTTTKYSDISFSPGGGTRYFYDSTPANDYGYIRYAVGFKASASTGIIQLQPTGLVSGEYIYSVSLKKILTPSNPAFELDYADGTSAFDFRIPDKDTRNIFIGTDAGAKARDAYHNVIIGVDAGKNLITAGDSILVGYRAGYNIISANTNYLIGWQAGGNLTIGNNNLLIGSYTGKNLTGGAQNTVLGQRAGGYLGTGDFTNCTLIGFYAGRDIGNSSSMITVMGSYAGNRPGTQSTVIGAWAGNSMNASLGAGATYNTIIGSYAGANLLGGASNIFIGNYAGNRQTTASNLLIIDNVQRADQATELSNSIIYGTMGATPSVQSIRLNAAITTPRQLFIDSSADEVQLKVQANATQTSDIIAWETSTGTLLGGVDEQGRLFSYGKSGITSNLCFGNAGEATMSGIQNIFIGNNVGRINTTGSYNVGIGENCLYGLTTGQGNVAIGREALLSVGTQSGNVAIGQSAFRNSTHIESVGIGEGAGQSISGSYNVIIGRYAAGTYTASPRTNINYSTIVGFRAQSNAATGSQKNTIIGAYAGEILASGTNNIFLGHYAGSKQTDVSNLFIVDNQARADVATEQSNAIIYGTMGATPSTQILRVNSLLTLAAGTYVSPSSGTAINKSSSAFAGTSVASSYGTQLSHTISYSSLGTGGTHVSTDISTTLQSSVSHSTLIGLRSYLNWNSSGGTTSIASNVYIATGSSKTGSATAFSQLLIDPVETWTSGTLASVYGIQVGNISAGGTNNYSLYTNEGIVRHGDQVLIEGSSDTTQLRVKANATQTSNLLTLESSGGTVYSQFTPSGWLQIGGTEAGTSLYVAKTLAGSGRSTTLATTNSTAGAETFSAEIGMYSRNTTATHGKAASLLLNAYHDRAGSVVNLENLNLRTYVSAGTITNWYSIRGETLSISGGASVGTLKYISMPTPVVTSGTLTNAYGIYINDYNTASTLNYPIYTNAGIVRFGDQLSIDGSSDRTQLKVKANATQTSSLIEWQNSSGNPLGVITPSGGFNFYYNNPTIGWSSGNFSFRHNSNSASSLILYSDRTCISNATDSPNMWLSFANTSNSAHWTLCASGEYIGIGNDVAPLAQLHVNTSTVVNNSIKEVQRLEAVATTSGLPGFGPALTFHAETSTAATNQRQAQIASLWTDSNNTTRKSKLQLSAYDTAQRVGIELGANGSAPTLGFFGATPITKPSAYTIVSGVSDRSYNADNTTVDELADIVYTLVSDLQALGLVG